MTDTSDIDDAMLWDMFSTTNPSPSTNPGSLIDYPFEYDISSYTGGTDMVPNTTSYTNSTQSVLLKSTATNSQKPSILCKVKSKTQELSAATLYGRDVEKLKTRLAFFWDKEKRSSVKPTTAVTAWRDSLARRTYRLIQEANPHFLVPFILTVPPTECSTPTFKEVFPELLRTARHLSGQIFLSPGTIDVLRSVIEEDHLDIIPGCAELLQSMTSVHLSAANQGRIKEFHPKRSLLTLRQWSNQ